VQQRAGCQRTTCTDKDPGSEGRSNGANTEPACAEHAHAHNWRPSPVKQCTSATRQYFPKTTCIETNLQNPAGVGASARPSGAAGALLRARGVYGADGLCWSLLAVVTRLSCTSPAHRPLSGVNMPAHYAVLETVGVQGSVQHGQLHSCTSSSRLQAAKTQHAVCTEASLAAWSTTVRPSRVWHYRAAHLADVRSRPEASESLSSRLSSSLGAVAAAP
jgi:hypothetical protein